MTTSTIVTINNWIWCQSPCEYSFSFGAKQINHFIYSLQFNDRRFTSLLCYCFSQFLRFELSKRNNSTSDRCTCVCVYLCTLTCSHGYSIDNFFLTFHDRKWHSSYLFQITFRLGLFQFSLIYNWIWVIFKFLQVHSIMPYIKMLRLESLPLPTSNQ